jgi:hypothetical protein
LSLAFFYWIDYLGFITEGKLAAIFIKPSLGVSNWRVIYFINYKPSNAIKTFSGTIHHRAITCRGTRGEEEGASSGAALEVALFRALSSIPASSRPWLVRGFRWQASLLHWRWLSYSLGIICLASLGLETPLIEHYLDGRSKPFCIQGPSRTYPQAGHKLRQSNLLGEALSEIGYHIQRRIEGKWFRPRVHP